MLIAPASPAAFTGTHFTTSDVQGLFWKANQTKKNKNHATESCALLRDIMEDIKEPNVRMKIKNAAAENMNAIVTSIDSFNKHLLK